MKEKGKGSALIHQNTTEAEGHDSHEPHTGPQGYPFLADLLQGKRTNANIKARHFPIIIGEDGHELNFLETVDFSTEQVATTLACSLHSSRQPGFRELIKTDERFDLSAFMDIYCDI